MKQMCVSPDLLYNVTAGNTTEEDIKDFMNLKGLLYTPTTTCK